jgi:hypothetical protein
VPTTGEQILWAQEDLLKVLLPTYIYERDWERAKLYYYAKLERSQRLIDKYSDKVDELEGRVAKLMAAMVDLENA